MIELTPLNITHKIAIKTYKDWSIGIVELNESPINIKMKIKFPPTKHTTIIRSPWDKSVNLSKMSPNNINIITITEILNTIKDR